MSKPMFRVLFVCTGNICRSPTAEGVFRAMISAAGLEADIEADSAGTIAFHIGEPPDERSQEAALERGIDLSGQRARQVTKDDFDNFDLLIAIDRSHHRELTGMCPKGEEHRVRLLLDFAPQANTSDVPDPFYGGLGGYGFVLDLVEAGAAGLLAEIRANRLKGR